MTRIAIFCDGTWNSAKIPETTSIHKLQAAVLSDPAQGQVAAYFAGVGTDDVERLAQRRIANRCRFGH